MWHERARPDEPRRTQGGAMGLLDVTSHHTRTGSPVCWAGHCAVEGIMDAIDGFVLGPSITRDHGVREDGGLAASGAPPKEEA